MKHAMAGIVLAAFMTHTLVAPVAGAVNSPLTPALLQSTDVPFASDTSAPAMSPTNKNRTPDLLSRPSAQQLLSFSDMDALCPPCTVLGVPVGKWVAGVIGGIVSGVIVYFATGGADSNEALEDFLADCEGEAEITWLADGSWKGKCTEEESGGNN